VLPEGVRPVFRVQSNWSPLALYHLPQSSAAPPSKLQLPVANIGGAGVGGGVGGIGPWAQPSCRFMPQPWLASVRLAQALPLSMVTSKSSPAFR